MYSSTSTAQQKPSLYYSINALGACVYISIRQLSSFRAPTLWFIDLTVASCHIQYTFLNLCRFFSRENGQNTKILEVRYHTKMAADVNTGTQSINTERASD